MLETSNGGSYEVWLAVANGPRIELLDEVDYFTYVKSLARPGTFYVSTPDIYPDHFWAPDRVLQFWRRGRQQPRSRLDFFGLLRRWIYATDAQGRKRVLLYGLDQNTLLDRRIVTYYAGHHFAQADAEADDVMKLLVRHNLGDLTDVAGTWTPYSSADRDLSDAGFEVQVDLSAGPVISKAFAWRQVGLVLRDLATMSRAKGTEVFYWVRVAGVDRNGAVTLRFETSTHYPGLDRTRDGTRPLLFGEDYGNVANASLEYNYLDEANHIYAGGQNQGMDRTIEQAADELAERVSPWARIERFRDARNIPDDQVQDAADETLAESRPVIRFEGDILDTPMTPYGNWNLGDLITVAHRNIHFDAVIRTVKVQVRGGQELIASRLKEEIAT